MNNPCYCPEPILVAGICKWCQCKPMDMVKFKPITIISEIKTDKKKIKKKVKIGEVWK